MRRVLITDDPVLVGHARNLLESEGIPCRMLNDLVSDIVVTSPFVSRRFELWIDDDRQVSRAITIIERAKSTATTKVDPRPTWKCDKCKQMIETQFTDCWYCSLTADHDPRNDREAECADCGYLLYGLPDRRCPECGEEF